MLSYREGLGFEFIFYDFLKFCKYLKIAHCLKTFLSNTVKHFKKLFVPKKLLAIFFISYILMSFYNLFYIFMIT